MHPFFYPAIALMQRLGYTKKFALLWLMSLTAVAVVVYNLYITLNEKILASQRELEGIALAIPISRTVQLFQQHRGLSMSVLGGNRNMGGMRAIRENEATGIFNATEEKLPHNLASSEDWRSIKANWKRLREEGLKWTVEENFSAHTHLIEQLLIFKIVVSGEYVLPLDSQIDTSYLIDVAINRLPMALERLGQIRAYGTNILGRKRATESQELSIKTLIAQFGDDLKFLRIDFERVGHYNPALQGALSSADTSINGSAQHIAELVASDILSGRFSTSPDDFFLKTSAAIDNGYAQMHELLLPMIETLIKARITQSENALYKSIAIASLLFLAAAYFSLGIYYSTIGSIRLLSRSARTFAGGNIRERIDLATHDEFKQIGDSFNEMADGFSALLAARKQAEESLSKESYKNETLLRMASDGIHILDLDGNVVQVNNAFCHMLGFAPEELLTMNVAQWDVQWSAAELKARIDALGNTSMTFETKYRCRDGKIIDVEISVVKVDIGDRQLVYCSARNITERKQAELAVIESREKLHSVIENALDAVVQMDARGIIIGWNNQAEKIFGWTNKEAIGRSLSETIIPPHYREAHVHGLKHFLASGESSLLNSRVELLGLHRDGHEFPIELSITALKMAGKYEFNGFIHDITKRKKSEETIWKQANFDALTGLPNRHMFYDRLEQETKKANRTDMTIALLFIDIDRFKEINDTLGHSMGDILLVETARRINSYVRETDILARLGGDEFTVLLTELNDIRRVDMLAQNILHEISKPFQLGNEKAYLSASIGITLYPVDTTVMEELLRNADQAMYAAKNAGRNRFNYFTQSMQQASQDRLRLLRDLRGALAADQFRLYYQPIVELATGRIHKAEALIRWQHPMRGLVSPVEFILLAEETGLIVEIGNWIFKEAAQQTKRWRTLYDPEFQISVNKSPVQFSDSGSSSQAWPAYLHELGLQGQSIVIEITEGLLLEAAPSVKDKLLLFRNAGIQISLDDFGTGYSSLSYLQKFNIDYLKIDQSFTRDLAVGSSNMALSEAIIVMAHKLGFKVIAEGVETEAQRTLLCAAGCDYAQGYLISKPVAAEEFEVLLEHSNTKTRSK